MWFWIWRSTLAPSDTVEKKKTKYGCTTTVLHVHKSPKIIWKIYLIYDFWHAQTCSFRAIFGLPVRSLTLTARALNSVIIVEIDERVRPCGATLYQKVEIFAILCSRVPTPIAPIGVKFCTAKRTHEPVDCAKFHMNRCIESPLRPVSKFKYRLTPLGGALTVKQDVDGGVLQAMWKELVQRDQLIIC